MKVFVPAPGKAFVAGDFSNLELRVMAFEFDDDVLQRMFAEGKNIHTENAKVMFHAKETDADWKVKRDFAKRVVFGRSYGGGIRGIYERVSAAHPEVNITMADFRTADRKYFEAHPKLREGFDRASKTARETRLCTTATGRKRFFLGTPEEIEREGINTPIQGAAGDIANESLIDVYEECLKHQGWGIVATVHDSIVLEVPIAEVPKAAMILKAIMEKPRKLWGRTVVFPAEISVSTKSWGELVEYEQWTEEHHKAESILKRKRKASTPQRPRSQSL